MTWFRAVLGISWFVMPSMIWAAPVVYYVTPNSPSKSVVLVLTDGLAEEDVGVNVFPPVTSVEEVSDSAGRVIRANEVVRPLGLASNQPDAYWRRPRRITSSRLRRGIAVRSYTWGRAAPADAAPR